MWKKLSLEDGIFYIFCCCTNSLSGKGRHFRSVTFHNSLVCWEIILEPTSRRSIALNNNLLYYLVHRLKRYVLVFFRKKRVEKWNFFIPVFKNKKNLPKILGGFSLINQLTNNLLIFLNLFCCVLLLKAWTNSKPAKDSYLFLKILKKHVIRFTLPFLYSRRHHLITQF